MQVFMGGERTVGRLSAYVCGVLPRQWRTLRELAERNVKHSSSWTTQAHRKTDGFVSFEELQAEIMDVWRRKVVHGELPHPSSLRARFNRFWLWATFRRES